MARHDSTRWVTVTRDNNSRAAQWRAAPLSIGKEAEPGHHSSLIRRGRGGEGKGGGDGRAGHCGSRRTGPKVMQQTFTQRLLLVLRKLVSIAPLLDR